MRSAVTGFVFGYVIVAILIAPSLLWGLHMTPTYTSGVRIMLDRTGVLDPLEKSGRRMVDLRDRVSADLAGYVERTMSRYLAH